MGWLTDPDLELIRDLLGEGTIPIAVLPVSDTSDCAAALAESLDAAVLTVHPRTHTTSLLRQPS